MDLQFQDGQIVILKSKLDQVKAKCKSHGKKHTQVWIATPEINDGHNTYTLTKTSQAIGKELLRSQPFKPLASTQYEFKDVNLNQIQGKHEKTVYLYQHSFHKVLNLESNTQYVLKEDIHLSNSFDSVYISGVNITLDLNNFGIHHRHEKSDNMKTFPFILVSPNSGNIEVCHGAIFGFGPTIIQGTTVQNIHIHHLQIGKTNEHHQVASINLINFISSQFLEFDHIYCNEIEAVGHHDFKTDIVGIQLVIVPISRLVSRLNLKILIIPEAVVSSSHCLWTNVNAWQTKPG